MRKNTKKQGVKSEYQTFLALDVYLTYNPRVLVMKKENFEVMLLPKSIWRGIKEMGISFNDVATTVEGFTSRFSDIDLAFVHAFGNNGDLKAVFPSCTSNVAWKLEAKRSDIYQLSASQPILDRVAGALSGEYIPKSPPIEVVCLSPTVLAVVLDHGCLDALRKDNNVLTVLTAIVQKALDVTSLDALPYGMLERFITVSSFANPNRPPSAVYK